MGRLKLDKKKRPLRIRHLCSHDGCGRRAMATRECITCEKLVEAGKRNAVHTLHSCGLHQSEILEAMKKHVLVGHPSNIVRATVAALKGEDVF